jgi:hypothetical protein
MLAEEEKRLVGEGTSEVWSLMPPSVVRFTDLRDEFRQPSDESLGYYHPSAERGLEVKEK